MFTIIKRLLLFSLLIFFNVKVYSEKNQIQIPKNSTFLGNDWYCDAGYKKIKNKCENIFKDFPNQRKPENSLLFGATWRCKAGYKKINKKCEIIELKPIYCPPNSIVIREKSRFYCGCKCGYSDFGGGCLKSRSNPLALTPDGIVCISAVDNNNKRFYANDNYYGYRYACEAKRRGLSCGVPETEAENQLNEVEKLEDLSDSYICYKAVDKNRYGTLTSWKPYSSKYVNEAKRRGLNCGVVEQEKFMNQKVRDKVLCETATFLSNITKKIEWNLAYARSSVDEARKRGLTCGVSGAVAEKERKAIEEKERKLAEERALKKKLAEEKERKAIEEKERKLAEERARKNRIAEEKARKKKEAAEKARKKKLAEQERKRKLEQDKLARKIKDYKRQAVNFYKDVEEFVKSGGKIDLVKLSKLFNIKPDPTKNWNSSDLKTFESLRQFMSSVSEFVSYEKQMIGERLKKSFALKDQSIAQLEKNLEDLKGLMRKMFGSSDVPKITKMISDIEASLNNFNQSQANKLIVQTTNYISSKLDKPKVVQKNKETEVINNTSSDQSWLAFKSKLTPQQEQFCKLTESFYKDLNKARKAKNEIMVNRVHKERQINLDGLIPNGKINNWIFRILKVDQVDNGSAAFVLSLQCNSYVGSGQIHTKSTWRKKSNKEWRATVPYNSRRFNELGKLSAGEFVLASGTLLEVNAFKPGQIETFYASQQIGEHPLTKDLNLEGELFLADLSYIAALN